MSKTIAMRGRREVLAVFSRYGKLSGNQDQGRPQSAADFVRFVAGLPFSEETKTILRVASKLPVDVRDIKESSVPASIKIPVDVTDDEWERAMNIFQFAFALSRPPQMPYFLRVAGMACIRSLEEQNAELGITEDKAAKVKTMDIDEFEALTTDQKLVEIYKFLIGRDV